MTFTDGVLGFLQNVLGNVISYQRIYDKIYAAVLANNIAEICFQAGRVFNLLFDFKPFE